MSLRVAALIGILAIASCSNGPEPSADPVAGEEVLGQLELSCGLCHTLENAGFTASVAPNLDELSPGFETVLDALRDGPGAMPSYRGELTRQEIRDLAAYISREAGR